MNEEELKNELKKEIINLCETNSSVMTYMECLMKSYEKLQQELDQYKNNWEELKGYIKKFPGISYASSEKVDGERLSGKLIPVTKVLNKMKELEENN